MGSAERGFTITELLVALTVTVIGLAGLLSLHVTTVRGNSSASHASEAIVGAEQVMEDLRQITVPAIETQWGTIATAESTGVRITPSVFGRTGTEYVPVLFTSEVVGQPNLVRLRLRVYWMDGGAAIPSPLANIISSSDHSIELQMLRTRVEIL